MAARRRRLLVLTSVSAIAVAAVILIARTEQGIALVGYGWGKMRGGYSVDERVAMYGQAVQARLKPRFEALNLPFPPADLAYVAFKDARILEVYARATSEEPFAKVLAYPIQGASGGPGPKLREGDRQVPEGIYEVELLNPNSRYHLSLRLNYPNAFDRAQGAVDGRQALGSDIMIHGTDSSIGCLAMGNDAAEDLFVLTALTGKERVQVAIAPTDFRRHPIAIPPGAPTWLPQLYADLQAALGRYPLIP